MICTPADILTFLDIATTATDHERSLIALLQPQVEQSIKDFVGFSVEQATHTHYMPRSDRDFNVDPMVRTYDAQGSKMVPVSGGGLREFAYLALPERPVRSVTSVHEDAAAYAGQGANDFADTTQLTAGTDYYLDVGESGLSMSGRLVRIGGSGWSARVGTIKVVYVAGYTATELATGIAAVFKAAVLHQLQIDYSAAGEEAGDVQSVRLGDFAATYAKRGDSKQQLSPKVKRMLQKHVRYSRFV